jgi:predicted transcriptional regulator
MATMTHRTTFALDQETARRLKRLAARWKVSQAEVVRRSVEQAEKLGQRDGTDAVSLLHRLHEAGGGLEAGVADKWLSEVREDRRRWRG